MLIWSVMRPRIIDASHLHRCVGCIQTRPHDRIVDHSATVVRHCSIVAISPATFVTMDLTVRFCFRRHHSAIGVKVQPNETDLLADEPSFLFSGGAEEL